jgi:N-glycosylase/DNA lyase
MSTWWRANTYLYEIKPAEVVGETAKFVTLAASESQYKQTRRAAKAGEYFPTFSEARTFLLGRLSNKFDSLNFELKINKQYHDKVFLMEEPK